MTIREIKLRNPIEITPFTSQQRINQILQMHRRSATVRTLSEGAHDVTDVRWKNRSHTWKVDVRPDGTGMLSISPTKKGRSIGVINVTPEKVQDTHGIITQSISRADRIMTLAGQETQGRKSGFFIFKFLEFFE